MAKQLVCTACGSVGRSVTVTKGSILIELALWCFFLVPGLIYSIWRLSSKHAACPSCGGASMIPVDSPMGRKLVGGY